MGRLTGFEPALSWVKTKRPSLDDSRKWWTWGGLNSRHLACHASALPLSYKPLCGRSLDVSQKRPNGV